MPDAGYWILDAGFFSFHAPREMQSTDALRQVCAWNTGTSCEEKDIK